MSAAQLAVVALMAVVYLAIGVHVVREVRRDGWREALRRRPGGGLSW